MRFEIQIQPVGKRINAKAGETLFSSMRDAGIQLASSCGGEGSCGLCRVVPLQGAVNPLTSAELSSLGDPGRRRGERLACQVLVSDDMLIQVPEDALIVAPRLQLDGDLSDSNTSLPGDSPIQTYHLDITPPTLEDARSDMRRITDTLAERGHPKQLSADLNFISKLPAALRENEWRVSVYVRDRQVIGIAPYGRPPLGMAVDLGTTKIAIYLVDLESGEALAGTGAPNPQIAYGEDVISRIDYVLRHPDGGRTLAGKVRETLNSMLGELLLQTGTTRGQVVDGCIVGNTAMLHLLAELPVRHLAKSPYVAAYDCPLIIPAQELGIQMAPGAAVYLPPTIGGFVGADHVAMILASGLDRSPQVTLGIDIGTNSEIVLRKPGQPHLTAASCPSGPAFEGAHIGDGMRAAPGAVERVRLTANGAALQTIDDALPVGLCGSGIVDVVAELYRVGLINNRGRFQKSHPRVSAKGNNAGFTLAPAEASGTGHDIIITQQDVNEIQLAKGAIYTGIGIILDATNTEPSEVASVIIAGAFGSLLDIENALAIGLFPNFPNANYRQVGNAAIVGAKQLLVSQAARKQAGLISAKTRYFELTTYPKFSRRFAYGMLFPTGQEPNGDTKNPARSIRSTSGRR